MLEIAGGIVLAILFFAFLPLIATGAAIALVVAGLVLSIVWLFISPATFVIVAGTSLFVYAMYLLGERRYR